MIAKLSLTSWDGWPWWAMVVYVGMVVLMIGTVLPRAMDAGRRWRERGRAR